jgi:hypothetical protein
LSRLNFLEIGEPARISSELSEPDFLISTVIRACGSHPLLCARIPILGSRMNTDNAYLLHLYHRVSHRKSGLKLVRGALDFRSTQFSARREVERYLRVLLILRLPEFWRRTRRMSRLQGKVALIIGAASGIGTKGAWRVRVLVWGRPPRLHQWPR